MATGTPRTPRHRISAIDLAAGEAFLDIVSLLIVPDDQSQRQAFEKLMPQIYLIRNKGYSYTQIANTLAEIGFKIKPSTVRNYYQEILATRPLEWPPIHKSLENNGL